ncbi:MAG: hypothetical protein HQ501_11625 [Rhodospirillales bacterium]|nr:hypothetical protein [Rhodospirillales bacterium]
MLGRFGRGIYWIGLIFGAVFLVLNLVPISVMLGILPGVEGGKPWIGMMILTSLGLLVWGIAWAIRYLTTGATAINPRTRGWYDDVA